MLIIGLMMRIVKRVSDVIGPSSRTRADLSKEVVVVVTVGSGVDVVVKVEEVVVEVVNGSELVEVLAVTTAGWSASLIGTFVVPF